jgi:hypothetical protein
MENKPGPSCEAMPWLAAHLWFIGPVAIKQQHTVTGNMGGLPVHAPQQPRSGSQSGLPHPRKVTQPPLPPYITPRPPRPHNTPSSHVTATTSPNNLYICPPRPQWHCLPGRPPTASCGGECSHQGAPWGGRQYKPLLDRSIREQ